IVTVTCAMRPPSCAAVGVTEHVADDAGGALDAAANVARRGLDPVQPRKRPVELDGEAGAIVLHDLQLGLEIAAPALGFEPPRHRRFEQPEGRVEALHRIVEWTCHAVSEKPAKGTPLNTRRHEIKPQSPRMPDPPPPTIDLAFAGGLTSRASPERRSAGLPSLWDDPVPEAAERVSHADLANAVRALAMDAVEQAKSGHPGLPMGAADVATVLFTKFLKYDATDPTWPDRDRFILSAGHGSMLLYALLHLTGVEGMTADELKRFRQLDSKTPGHPENFMTPGVETTTGPLGQGIATAVGFALAERMLNAEYGDDLVDHYTYVLASDGDLMEGISQEAIALAGHLKLNRMIVLWDDNEISIDGPLSLSDSVDQVKRFEACGWAAERVDGLDRQAVAAAIERARISDKPTLIACKTIIGYGAPHKQGTSKAHGEPLGPDEAAAAKARLGIEGGPFEVPLDVIAAWREAGRRGGDARMAWEERRASLTADRRAELDRRLSGKLPGGLDAAIVAHKKSLAENPVTVATRKASELALDVIVPVMPELVLGSADLTPSNNTKAKGLVEVRPDDYSGRYIHYGIREHGMAAAMNGLS